FWVADPAACEDRSHGKARLHAAVTLRQRRFFLPWVWHYDYADRFDAAGNLLAILGDVATPEQAGQILDYIHGAGIDRPFPVRVLYPPIRPGDPDWREYYRVWNLNLPDHYHNGGIWPWVGGAYVAALVRCGRREEAQRQLVALAKSLNQGSSPGECNEWLHGVSGEAMGAKHQAWSAGMFLYAVHAVRTGCTPGLAADYP
ncbi:MAG: glycogen debranching protein, partial [Hyphomicrobiales bacterium]